MAGQQYDDTNRGALFRNKKKQPGDNKPDYTGKINIEGEEYFISGWLKQSREGMPYMSLAIQTENRPGAPPAQQQKQKPAAQAQGGPQGEPFGVDDIPF